MTTSSKPRSPFVSIVILLIAMGLIATYSSFLSGASNTGNTVPAASDTSVSPDAPISSEQQNNGIVYPGKSGVDALKLLQANHTIDASPEGFVNSIDGVKPADKQYWAFYINGELSMTGAKETITKDSDSVEWKLVGY